MMLQQLPKDLLLKLANRQAYAKWDSQDFFLHFAGNQTQDFDVEKSSEPPGTQQMHSWYL